MKYFILALIVAFNLSLSAESNPSPAPSPYNSCVKLSQSGPNRSAYSFYNMCGEKLWINACIEGAFGKTQLVKSATAVKSGGRFTIYPFFDIDVRNIQWSAHPYQPIIPGSCGLPKKK
jgi:hypothetical protein